MQNELQRQAVSLSAMPASACRAVDECLNEHLFTSYNHARDSIKEWRYGFNQTRPHLGLNWLTSN